MKGTLGKASCKECSWVVSLEVNSIFLFLIGKKKEIFICLFLNLTNSWGKYVCGFFHPLKDIFSVFSEVCKLNNQHWEDQKDNAESTP